MLSILEVLDLARARQGGVSDYRLAQLLGVKQPTVSGYRSGRTVPDMPVLARLSELSGVDIRCLMLWAEAQRAASPEARELWEKLSTAVDALYLPADFCEKCRAVTVENARIKPASPALARVVERLRAVDA